MKFSEWIPKSKEDWVSLGCLVEFILLSAGLGVLMALALEAVMTRFAQ